MAKEYNDLLDLPLPIEKVKTIELPPLPGAENQYRMLPFTMSKIGGLECSSPFSSFDHAYAAPFPGPIPTNDDGIDHINGCVH